MVQYEQAWNNPKKLCFLSKPVFKFENEGDKSSVHRVTWYIVELWWHIGQHYRTWDGDLHILNVNLIFMEPCIVVWLVAIINKMQLSNGILVFHSTLIVQHVSSVMSLIIRNLNCICSFWFTYARGDRPWCRLSGNWLRYSACCCWSSCDQQRQALYLSQFPLRRHHGRSPRAYVNQKLQIQLRFLMMSDITLETCWTINPLNLELNPICYLLALLGAHHFLHVSRIRVKLLTFRLWMSYICIWSTHSWCF